MTTFTPQPEQHYIATLPGPVEYRFTGCLGSHYVEVGGRGYELPPGTTFEPCPEPCPAAANLRGERISCDLPAGHDGLEHSNSEHELIWIGPAGGAQ